MTTTAGEENVEDKEVKHVPEFETLAEAAAVSSKIYHMRGVVHTLQLTIRDGLKGRHAMVRKIATVARNPKIDSVLKRRAENWAIIDQTTK